MDHASEALMELRPVVFRYKKEIDPARRLEFGLVAEDVEKINPELIVRDKQGRAYTVRYDGVNAMLLNEFLKEHKAFTAEQHNVKKLEATVEQQQKQIETLTAVVQKVSAQLEMSKAAPQNGSEIVSKTAQAKLAVFGNQQSRFAAGRFLLCSLTTNRPLPLIRHGRTCSSIDF